MTRELKIDPDFKGHIPSFSQKNMSCLRKAFLLTGAVTRWLYGTAS